MKNLPGKVSVLMPVYNEGMVIEKSIKETIKTFDEFGCEYEIIAIDDGSTDNSLEIISRIAVQYHNIIIKRNRLNYGKGRALKTGFRSTRGDYVVFLDADMDMHPAQLQTFFDIMRLDDADVVIGSKRHPNSKLIYPLQRRLISSVYFFLIKLFFGLPINDTQTGLKIFKREVLERVFPRILVKKFAYDLEILVNAHNLGYKIAEAPVVINFRKKMGGIGMRSIYTTWVDTMAIWYRLYILKYYERFDNHRGQKIQS